jgi:hypothetical protein
MNNISHSLLVISQSFASHFSLNYQKLSKKCISPQYCLLSFMYCKYCLLSYVYSQYHLPLFMYWKLNFLSFDLVCFHLYTKNYCSWQFMFAFDKNEWDISIITLYYCSVPVISFIFYITGKKSILLKLEERTDLRSKPTSSSMSAAEGWLSSPLATRKRKSLWTETISERSELPMPPAGLPWQFAPKPWWIDTVFLVAQCLLKRLHLCLQLRLRLWWWLCLILYVCLRLYLRPRRWLWLWHVVSLTVWVALSVAVDVSLSVAVAVCLTTVRKTGTGTVTMV